MIRCIIIDDEPLAREILEGYLKKSGIEHTVVPFGRASQAYMYLQNEEADVLFLDIEMPEMNGIDFLKALSQPPVTVFTTAYRNYAFEGFELGKIVIKGSIGAMHEIFPATHFIRVHKSFIVALEKVKRIEKNRIVIDANQIPIGRNFKEEVLKVWQAG